MDTRRLKRVYIDMDGVLCDFEGAFKREKSLNPNQPFPQSQYGFFLNLKPITGAIEAVNKLKKDFEVWILTRPSVHNIHCYSEKAFWIRQHLGFDLQERTILCTDKSLLKGDFLIDDQTNHGQDEFEGELILFGSKKFPNWNHVLKFFGNKDSKFESLYGC